MGQFSGFEYTESVLQNFGRESYVLERKKIISRPTIFNGKGSQVVIFQNPTPVK